MIRTSGFLPVLAVPFTDGSVTIPTYFVATSAVFVGLAFIIKRLAIQKSMSVRSAMDSYLVIMISGFWGARLVHVFWEEPAYYFEEPLRIFDFMAGGFVWFGGVVGALVGFRLLHRFNAGASAVSTRRWLDFFSPVIAIGYSAGRFACFLTGCCFGRVCDLPAVGSLQLPTQIFAMAWEALAATLLWRQSQRPLRDLEPGRIFWIWLAIHGVGRVLMELMRADDRGPSSQVLGVHWTLTLKVAGCLAALGLYQISKRSRRS